MASQVLTECSDYESALARVTGLADFERGNHSPEHSSFHLERMSLLLERLGNPHLKVPTVHVAGTKGKGSVSAMVTSILAAAGYKVGLYTSPHLHTLVERIRVGLDPIGQRDFVSLVNQVWPAIEWVAEHGKHGPATFFELMTASAFLHFKQIGANVQVVEVGLGGRLDATNVVEPMVCIITRISLDHLSILGNTVGLIAGEKAGIIKQGVSVVVAPQCKEAMNILLLRSRQRNAPVMSVSSDLSWQGCSTGVDGQSFDMKGLRGRHNLWMPLLGEHQIENAATAIAAVEILADKGFTVLSENVREGLRNVQWPGRFQVICNQRTQVVVDGAHNPHSMQMLAKTVKKNLTYRNLILVFGATSGHNPQGMLAEMAKLSPSVIAVRARHPRSVPSNVVALAAEELELDVLFESDDVGLATRRALEISRKGDLVLGTGSLAVVAEMTEEILGLVPEIYPNIKHPPFTSGASRGEHERS